MTVGDGEIHLDFTGSDVQVASALNVPTGGHAHLFMAIALFKYFITKDPGTRMLRPIPITLPVDSVVNRQVPHGVRCSLRYVLRIYDTVLGALRPTRGDHRAERGPGAGWSRWRCPTLRPSAGTLP